ncbi:hypothetical protein V2J09_008553 [Rumex salicifolius]
MTRCISLTAIKDWCLRSAFSQSGLRPTTTDLGDGTVMHCWVPKNRVESKPDLVLIHGFGANALWQWDDVVSRFARRFNIYVPDLVFFGGSYTTRPERSDSFQAECVMRVVEANSDPGRKVSVVGLSYGGFVAYRMAAQFKEKVERAVICCAGVCMEEKDLAEGMFRVSDLEAAADILLPRTPEKLRELMGFTLTRPPKIVPSCFLYDFIDAMCSEYVEERKDLLRNIPKGRRISDLPTLSQPTLIIWGDQDQIFPVELGHRLKRHLGECAELVVIKDTGHAFNMEKPKEFYQHLKAFLVDSCLPVPNNGNTKC